MRTVLLTLTASLILTFAAAAQPSPDELWEKYAKAASEAQRQGNLKEAEKYWRVALARAESLGPDSHLAIALDNLSSLCSDGGRYDEAIAYLKRELALRERAAPGGNRYTINVLNSLAMMYESKGDEAEAEKHFRRALKLADSTPETDEWILGTVLNNLGEFYLHQEKYADAEIMFERVRNLARGDLDQGPIRAAPDVAFQLAITYERQGKYMDAERLLLDEANAEEQQGSVDIRLGESLRRMADYHFGHDEFEPAAMLYERALGVYEKLGKSEASGLTAQCLYSLADLYGKWGMPDKAEATYRRELEIEMGDLGATYFGTPLGLVGLGNLLRDQGRLEEIEPLAREALSRLEGKLGAEHPETVMSLTYLAQIETELNKNDEAEPLLRRAIAIQEKTLGPNHPQLGGTLAQYVALLRATGLEAEAARISQRLEQIQSRKDK